MTTPTEQVFTFDMLADYPEGPWTGEPDKVVWIDPVTDLDCMAKRGPMGNWCGYVAVAEGHPWFGKGYEDVELYPEVHGGLTYAAFCMEHAGDNAVCHTPAPGRPARVWWLGFDCGHACDVVPIIVKSELEVPGMPRISEMPGTTYKPLGYVKDEVLGLAAQAAAAAT